MNRIKINVVIALILSATTYAQNVGINGTGATPNSSAQLDLNTGNTFTSPNGRGLLIPNVALTGTGDNVTCSAAPATSLFVYNTATAGASPTNVVPGFYYWNGAKWVAFGGTGSLDWSLTGNAGTTVGTNFLGTTDNNDLEFKVNNIRSGLIDIADYQTFFGYGAGQNNTAAGILNSFFGFGAGSGTTSGTGNTGIGYNSITSNLTGLNNTAIGVQSLNFTTGNSNVALGTNAGYSINSGTQNTALGFWAMNNGGANNLSGSDNTSAGALSGAALTTGSSNTFLGYNSNLSTGTFNNVTAIGANAYPGASNVLILGGISGVNGGTSVNVGIGISAPTSLFHIVDAASAFTTGTLATITGNALTTGNGLLIQSSSLTSGNLVYINATNAAATGPALSVNNSSQSGNAIFASGGGAVNYSAIYGQNAPTTNGTGFDISLSSHTIAGEINLNLGGNYGFGVLGETVSFAEPCAGVIGIYSPLPAWGALGYRNKAGTADYGAYFTSAAGVGTGRMSNPKLNNNPKIDNAAAIGMAAYGDLFGGWIRGNVYGMAVRGERVSLYVDGKTVVNQPIIQLSKTADNKTIVNYTPASATADLQLHGVVKMENGVAIVSLDQETLSQFISTEDLTIIATPTGQTNGVYVELRGSELVIKENNNGKANTKVSWIIIGQRNIGDNTLPDEFKATDFDNNLRGFMNNENDKSTTSTGLYWNGTTLTTMPSSTGTPIAPGKKQ
jgi:hypothetical protein